MIETITTDMILGGAWLFTLVILVYMGRRLSRAEKAWSQLGDVIKKSQSAASHCHEALSHLDTESQTLTRSLEEKMQSAARLIQDLDFLSHRAQKITDVLERFSSTLSSMGDKGSRTTAEREPSIDDEDPRSMMDLR